MNDHQRFAVYRILDASANRASEGLRTLEAFARMMLDDAERTSQLKTLRHSLASAMENLDRPMLLQARDTPGDVGTRIGTDSEYARTDLTKVIAAAAARTQQSLRVLEEYAKTLDAQVARTLEQLRYDSYTIAADIELQCRYACRKTALESSHLYVLVDCCSSESAYRERLESFFDRSADTPVDLVQLRDNRADDRTLLARARVGVAIARDHGKLFIVNNRCDIAVAADADGVHVGQEDLPVADARKIVGPTQLIGVSTHSVEQARQAVDDGADYIGCGPVFPSQTKSFDQFVGPALVQEVSRSIGLVTFAIGGIDQDNVEEVVAAGCPRIAVTGAVNHQPNPTQAASELKSRLTSTAMAKPPSEISTQ